MVEIGYLGLLAAGLALVVALSGLVIFRLYKGQG